MWAREATPATARSADSGGHTRDALRNSAGTGGRGARDRALAPLDVLASAFRRDDAQGAHPAARFGRGVPVRPGAGSRGVLPRAAPVGDGRPHALALPAPVAAQ